MPRKRGVKDGQTSSIPNVYRDMLADVASSPMQSDDDGRSVKKRRVAGRVVIDRQECTSSPVIQPKYEAPNDSIDDLFEEPAPVQQHIYQSGSEDSADSDINWEEVNLKDDANGEASSEAESHIGELNLVLGVEKRGPSRIERERRKPITAAERKLRLEVHKMHLCSLLVHVYIRNHWCNDLNAHSRIRKLLSKKMVSYLNPDETASQFQRSRSFMDGLQQASDVFRRHFNITRRGMTKARWRDASSLASAQVPDDIDLPIQREDFVSAANDLQGSRDLGSQVFCAMLRAAGVEARLVCSLQPLQFRAVEKTNNPQPKYAIRMPLEPETRNLAPVTDSDDEEYLASPRPIGSHGGRSRFTPDPADDASTSLPSRIKGKSKKLIRESKYPIFWVEALNEAIQKWVPVDPLVTQTIAKPSRFEPPAGERENSLSYVIAFEDDDSARDVTRRYAKAYNAKTRRDRVEATKGGELWWRRALKMFRRRQRLDRDQLEDAELTAREVAEPMPRNVQDFKDHPYYALERHLRRHEVIHPRREVGKVGAVGKGHSTSALEPIYRRRDVLHVQSADKWYRKGREIKPGEQPLKRVIARKKRHESLDIDDQDATNEELAGTALYSVAQTTIHKPAPIINKRITKNVYGNLDVYVPSMIPLGGAHIQHRETARVARILGIDYADAITGFTFKGRHGTAVTNGAVVAAEDVEAVLEVINALEDERLVLEQERRSQEALAVWRRLMMGLRIRERIEGYEVEGEREYEKEGDNKKDGMDEDFDEGGGFLPDRNADAIAEPTAVMTDNVQPHEFNQLLHEHQHKPTILLPPREPLHITVVYGDHIVDKEVMHPAEIVRDTSTQHEDLFNENDGEGGGFLIENSSDDAEETLLQKTIAESNVNTQNITEAKIERVGGALVEQIVNQSTKQPDALAGMPPWKGGHVSEGEECRKDKLKEEQSALDTIAMGQGGDGINDDEGNDSEDEEDQGSLLSHDPEDEDVDPDWVD